MSKPISGPKTVIQLNNCAGELHRIEIAYDDADTMSIAQAVIAMVESTGMSMDSGDSIVIFDVGVD